MADTYTNIISQIHADKKYLLLSSKTYYILIPLYYLFKDIAKVEGKLDQLWSAATFMDLQTPMEELLNHRYTSITGKVFPRTCSNKKQRLLSRWKLIWTNGKNWTDGKNWDKNAGI